MFDALFQALFSYRPVVFQQGEFRFDLTGASFFAAGVVAVAVGGFYLVTEHTAHLLGALPYLLLLACPLMHVFMHRGHGHHGHQHGQTRSSDDEQRRQ